jgi:predicted nucleotidyltransferase
MNPFVQQIVNTKIKELTPEQLMKYSVSYNVPLSIEQAKKVVAILKTKKINIYDEAQRTRLLNKIKTQLDQKSAKKVDELLQQFIHLL